jgi:hypothetical protein
MTALIAKDSFQCEGDRRNPVHRFRSSHLVAAHAFAETRKAKAYEQLIESSALLNLKFLNEFAAL